MICPSHSGKIIPHSIVSFQKANFNAKFVKNLNFFDGLFGRRPRFYVLVGI